MKATNKEIQADYTNRLNRVFDFIDQNLESDLSLSTVSEIAFFSAFHFHRVFKFVTGETLNEYVTRHRIEKSALDLLHKNISTTEIAHTYGFSDNSSYSRTFKKYFGVSPTGFIEENPNRHSKIRQLKSKNGQDYPDREKYLCIIDNLKKWTEMNAQIEVKETPELHLAAVTHVGIDGIENAFAKLIKWVTPKGLLQHPEAKMGRVFYDSFKVTAPDKVRMSIFLTIHEPFEADGEINKITIQKARCIVGRFEITSNEFEKSWTSLFVWMNENGYKKSSENPFEIYHNDYRKHPENKFIVDLNIPLE
ncbi:MAG: GyrI-like domain-containing protein [Ekhidna sp.]